MEPASHFYEFDNFRIDPIKRLLIKNQQPIGLTAKVFDTLLFLVQNRGRVVEKEEIMKSLWPDSFVEEGNLTVNISMLRKALEENRNDHRYIITIPGHGYKFIAEVREGFPHVPSTVQKENLPEIKIQEVEKGNLKRFAWVGLVLIVLLLPAFSVLWKEKESPAPHPDISTADLKSIAVLPFRPLDDNEEDRYLGVGMADTLITKLSAIRQVIVRPTSAILKYSDSSIDSLSAGREQKVDAVLEGSIERFQQEVRITARLMDVRDGSAIWTYECDQQECKNIFELQDLISEKIADALLLNLTLAQRVGLRKHYTESRAAYEAYVRGRYYWNKRTSEGLLKAIDYFQQAVQADPQYALAYTGLADSYSLGVWYIPIPPSEAIPKLKEAATKALQLDPNLAEAHLAMQNVYSFAWDWKRGLDEMNRAVELNPGYPTAHHWRALCLATHGRMQEAIAEAKVAQQLDPLSLVINADLGWVYYYARQYDEAIEQLQKTVALDPNFGLAHFDLAFVYSAKGMNPQAIAEIKKASERNSDYLAGLGYIYGAAGDKKDAQDALVRLANLSKRQYVPPYHFAWIYVGLGEKDQAIAELQQVYREHTQHVVDLKTLPMFDPLRSDPRFVQLIQQIGL